MDFRKEVVAKEKLHLNLARLRKGGFVFEINIDPDLAVKHLEGEKVPIADVLKAQDIFHDAQKGEIASEEKMQEFFGTTNPVQVAEKILTEGEIQFTADYRAKIRAQKEKRIIEQIHKYGVDPRTKAPHPPQRIQNAFEEGKIKIDERRPIDQQVKEIIKKLQPILPIRFENKQIEIIVPAHHVGKCNGIIRNLGSIKKEEWNNDGSWTVVLEIPGGLEDDLYSKLNNITRGTVQTRRIGE